MNCQEMEELLGAYALEALSEEERKAADAHLATCAKCTQTLKQLQAIVDLFPLSVPAVEPPPRVKAQILARIQENEKTQKLPPLSTPIPVPMPVPVRQQRAPVRWRTALLAASTLVLLVLLGASFLWNIALRQQVAQSPVVYQLHGTGDTASASGQLIYYPQQNITVLVVHNLPPLTGTQVYQGWLLHGNQPTSIGLFNIDNGVATLDFQGAPHGFDAAAVSLEHGPQASRDAPQGPVVALGTLTP
ncbi:MAG TPA: anti-sigma factor [Ktedonobacteraceae bacterium]